MRRSPEVPSAGPSGMMRRSGRAPAKSMSSRIQRASHACTVGPAHMIPNRRGRSSGLTRYHPARTPHPSFDRLRMRDCLVADIIFPWAGLWVAGRPLHDGADLARRFLDPTLASEIRLDVHHAGLYVSRRLGTWPESMSNFDEFVFLWESDRLCAVSAGLPERICSLVRHPFDPFFRQADSSGLGPRLADRIEPSTRRVIFAGPPEATRGVQDALRLPSALRSNEPTQLLVFLREPRIPEPIVSKIR